MVTSAKKAVYTALVGNLGIAIAKFTAAVITGSVGMLAETIRYRIHLTKYCSLLESRQVPNLRQNAILLVMGKNNSFGLSSSQQCCLEYLVSSRCNKALAHY